MHFFFRSIALGALVLASPGISAQKAAPEEYGPQLYVWLSLQGDVWISLYSEPASDGADELDLSVPLHKAAGAVPDSSGDYPTAELEEGWYSVYVEGSIARDQWVRGGTLSLTAVLHALDAIGIEDLYVEITMPLSPQTTNPEGFAYLYLYRGDVSYGGEWPLAEVPTELTLSYGMTERDLVRRLVTLGSLLVIPLLVLYAFRRWALRQPPSLAGGTCLVASRTLSIVTLAFWALWVGGYLIARPLLPIPIVSSWAADYWRLINLSTGIFVAAAVALCFRPILYPVFARFPGATWTRKDFWIHSLVMQSMVVALLGFLGVSAPRFLDESILGLLALIIVSGIFLLSMNTLQLRFLGLQMQVLEDGDLYDTVHGLTDKAGVAIPKAIHIAYMTKFPMPNAFAMTGHRIMLTDYLLSEFSKREVVAILSHELGHLKLGHPQKIARILLGVTVAMGGVAAASALLFTLLTYSPPPILEVVSGLLSGQIPGAEVVLGFAGAVLLVVLLFWLYYRHRRSFEFEADREALALSDDPHALISALAKLARLNSISFRTRHRFSTHPSMAARIERIAQNAGVSEEMVESLVSVEAVGTAHFEIPESATIDRIFSTAFKGRVGVIVSLVMFVIPMSGGVLAAYLMRQLPEGSLVYSAPMFAIVLGAVILFAQNRVGYLGFPKLGRELAANIDDEALLSKACFVSFSPNDTNVFYENCTNWDVGFLVFEEDILEYRGDAATFSLHRSQILTVRTVIHSSGWLKTARVRIEWRGIDNETEIYTFTHAGRSSITAGSRWTLRLQEELERWLAARPAADASEARFDGPPPIQITGIPVAQMANRSHLLIGTVVVGFMTMVAGYSVGLESGVVASSIWTASMIAMASTILASLPTMLVPVPKTDKPTTTED